MSINSHVVTISALPYVPFFVNSIVVIYTDERLDVYHQNIHPGSSTKVDLSSFPHGKYYLCIYVKSSKTDDLYCSYIKYGDIPICITSSYVHFLNSFILPANIDFYERLPNYDTRVLEGTHHIQSRNVNIKNLARQITVDQYTQIDRIRAVHEWVAKNISYDKDSLIDDVHVMKDNTALGAYAGRKCVCRGYTNLVVAMLRSLRIPAVCVYCQTLEIYNDGKWEDHDNFKGHLNHVFPAAYAGNRWVLMDTTWDSRNIYENGSFSHSDSIVYPYKYFDVSLEFLSQTHRFVAIGF